jgi:hypothetical protein
MGTPFIERGSWYWSATIKNARGHSIGYFYGLKPMEFSKSTRS